MTIADVKSEILEYLNSSKGAGYGSFDSNPNYKLEAIQDAIIDADYQVSMAIAATAGHSHRSKFAVSGTLPGDPIPTWKVLPEADSDPEGVMIETHSGAVIPGAFAPSDKLKLWTTEKAEYGGDDVIDGYFAISSNMIIFTGVNVSFTQFTVPVIARTVDSTAVLNTPDVYQATVVKLASAFMLSKLEDYMGAAQMCEGLARTDIQNIKADKYFVPMSLLSQKQE